MTFATYAAREQNRGQVLGAIPAIFPLKNNTYCDFVLLCDFPALFIVKKEGAYLDTLLYAGDHAPDGRGLPAPVHGARELLQRALIRLCVKKGSFALDPGLGSELYRLPHVSGAALERAALSFVQEALVPLPQLSVRAVQCAFTDSSLLSIAVEVVLQERAYTLELEVEE